MDEERRRRIREDAPPGEQGTDKAIKLSAWNSAKIVETDGRDAGLANRFNGQGHRAQLAAKLAQHGGYDEGREAAESRYGEERQLYLQERAAAAAAATGNNNNYIATTQPAQPARRPGQHNNGRINSTPRSFSATQSNKQQLNRGRSASGSMPRAYRAPSPRTAGTVRFRGGLRVQHRVPVPRPKVTHSKSSAAPTTPSNTSVRIAPIVKPIATPINRPQPAALAVVPTHPKGVARDQQASKSTEVSPALEPSASSLNRLQPAALAILRTLLNAALCDQQAPKAAASAGSTQVCEPDAIEQTKRHIAVYHATNPSEESLDYYQRHPEQTHLVKRAHYKLIKDLNDLAKNTDTREVAGYLDFNKSHVWMYEEVLTAKSMVEKGQIEELNARCVAHPVLAHFGDAAKFYYGANPESTEDTAGPSPPSPEKSVVQLAEAENSPELAVTNTIAAEIKATPAPAAGPHVPPGSSNQAPSTSIPVRDPATTTVNPLQQVPTTGGLGQLSAVFHDASGAFLGEKSWSTRLAANVTVNIKTIQSHVNVDKLVEDVQTFAQQLGRPAESPISQALRRAGEELTAYGRAMSDASSEGSQRIPGHGMWPEGYDADLSSGEEL
ncbi:hypothetical protein LTR91_020653 [Friedmanniomyces endolithicus]|uniref:Uncharacterized protein n=1 Tax=Friedmanniomyces endolithicus TaxID=329885 RepID=A0AAN6HC09_9PEZI|nr:hypothetical protein LTR57_021916 [Friedmanniomyces endolithicus]KAK0959049.1 hypothetical protein LTS01_021559 [Friedmanniomyces endolithicus]KAK0959790.1 hypothetical protein LTR91_020653 [Friedmanniomyces endolithicus]KAK1030138.1 hypothetical protein LTS16_019155 [Friedmanniomyces endolithicus]